jgi:hypothetical protein
MASRNRFLGCRVRLSLRPLNLLYFDLPVANKHSTELGMDSYFIITANSGMVESKTEMQG